MKKAVMGISGCGKAAVDIVLIDRIRKLKEQARMDIDIILKECKTEGITTTSDFEIFEFSKEKKNKKGKTKKNWER